MAQLTIYLSNETSLIKPVTLRPTDTVKTLKQKAAAEFGYKQEKVILIYQ